MSFICHVERASWQNWAMIARIILCWTSSSGFSNQDIDTLFVFTHVIRPNPCYLQCAPMLCVRQVQNETKCFHEHISLTWRIRFIVNLSNVATQWGIRILFCRYVYHNTSSGIIYHRWLTRAGDQSMVPWASYQIRKIAGCACAGNAGNVFPRRLFQRKPLVSDPGMHHGTCVTHVPWCMSGSLTCGDGENVPGIPGACAPANLRIWQEAHCV